MEVENNTWIMYGVDESDPECLHTPEELIAYINEVGFLPLFKNAIPGFSVEERTSPIWWWSGIPEKDPWEWRAILARSREVAYGKFFDKKAGFISRKWLPYFVNYRRDGYDFDSLWEDGKAPIRQKKIMDLFAENSGEQERYSPDIKKLAGFGKDGEKNFPGTITDLEMETYLCMVDFKQRKNKKGALYGWPVAVYAAPEHVFGRELVTSCYREDPLESGNRIIAWMKEIYPIATEDQIRALLGNRVGVLPERKSRTAKSK